MEPVRNFLVLVAVYVGVTGLADFLDRTYPFIPLNLQFIAGVLCVALYLHIRDSD